jgi:hypothetical protein
MTDNEFDAALVSAAFALGADTGWRKVSAATAAQRAGLELATARSRFAHPGMILARFGTFADIHALTGALADGPIRERLFDIILRRFDFLQLHRPGVLALLKILPLEPVWAAYLAKATADSMGWILEAAGVSAQGVTGGLRKQGLLAVWVWGLRAWMRDETPDLTTTMAAVDVALTRAEQIAGRFDRASPVTDVTDIAVSEIVDADPDFPPTPVQDEFFEAPPDVP